MLTSTLMLAIEQGGKVLTENFDKLFSITFKDGDVNNLVTAVDKESESVIRGIIEKEFPEHAILSEESGHNQKKNDYQWIIDPLDGTVNYAHQIPFCAVNIGISVKGETIMGATFNPFSKELYFAEKGKGAFCNGKRIKVSDCKDLDKAILCTGFPYKSNCQLQEEGTSLIHIFEKIVNQHIPVRRFGSAAMDLAWVASGKLDAFYESNLNPWDTVTGALLVTEAGGKVTDRSGILYSPFKSFIVSSNQVIHEHLLELVQ